MRTWWWKLAWLVLGLLSLYLLNSRWQLELLTLTPVNTVALVQDAIASDDLVAAADLVKFCQEITPANQQEELSALAAEIETRRSTLDYQVQRLVTEPLLFGTSDEFAGQAVALLSSLLLWGDIRDLSHQVLRYFQDEPVDEWVVTLSTLGLLASLSQAMSLGGTTPTKAGFALLSLAHKTGALTEQFRRYFLLLVGQVRDSRTLHPVLPTLRRLTLFVEQSGLPSSLVLLSRVHGPGDLNRMTRLVQQFGPVTIPLIKVGGESVVGVAHAVDRLGGAEVVKAASRYGEPGIRTLGTVGPVRFMKYGSRLANIGYQYSWLSHLARTLLRLPAWVLRLGTTLGLLFGFPWPWRKLFY